MSESTYSVKECLKCGELMPLYEKVCYCDGPVIVKSVGIDKKAEANYYSRRKFLHGLRGN